MRRLFVALVLVIFAASPGLADVRIVASNGGEVDNYLMIFAKLRASGERIVLDGPCLSACTLVLSTIPRSRICVTSRAVLGFHAPRLIDERGRSYADPQDTRLVIASYPPSVRAWIGRHGGLSSKLIYLRGRELAALYRHC